MIQFSKAVVRIYKMYAHSVPLDLETKSDKACVYCKIIRKMGNSFVLLELLEIVIPVFVPSAVAIATE